ncbi:phospholipase D-like protein [Hasllibacter halocynthiae]|uniref:Phospholipase D-like protein n=1 Tax=Hasllibacter halocynthiae TaxID=595589 RepID=A0A2T0X1T8_9RHOB|nr:PLDc N-terminal domain-containing protein [Hasllibacter halocynthiae]PRY92912.1 phospholipase D-like protein [Hasllibacter halocynthiae]
MEWLLGIVHLVLVIWALVNILSSADTTGAKVLWSLGVLIFPLVGFIVWFFAGPRGSAA